MHMPRIEVPPWTSYRSAMGRVRNTTDHPRYTAYQPPTKVIEQGTARGSLDFPPPYQDPTLRKSVDLDKPNLRTTTRPGRTRMSREEA